MKQIQSSNIQSDTPELKTPIVEVMSRHGLSIDDLVKCGKEGLTAMRETNKIDDEGDNISVPDYHVRHKYFASFVEMLGYFKDKGTTVNFITAEDREMLKIFERRRNVN